jgi:hypothetical protein
MGKSLRVTRRDSSIGRNDQEAAMTDAGFVERRGEQRRRTLKSARILMHKTSVISCIVRNTSLHGSRIAIDSIVGVPDEFTLDVFGERPRQARVVWKRSNEIGLVLQ